MSGQIGHRTLDAAFQAVAGRKPGLACIAVPPAKGRDYAPDGLEWSYGETAERVEAAAQAYAKAGYGHGHRVALLLENRPDFLVHFLALNRLGCCAIPINPDYRAHDMAYLLEHSGSDLAVVLDHRVADVHAVAQGIAGQPPVCGLSALAGLPRARRAALAMPPGRASETVLLYTSGTTGLPKGCMIDNEYLFYAAERYNRAGGAMAVRPEAERLYNPLPLFYANSVSISNPAMILGGNCMIFPDRFHPKSFWADLIATRASMIHYLGIIPPVMMNMPESPEERQHGVRCGIGAGIDPALHGAFERRFGFPLIEVWGMSELGIVTAANHEPRHIESRSIGQPLWDAEVALQDDSGILVQDEGIGELVVRRQGDDPRKGFFREYFRDPETTADAWRGGWFHTGDIVRRDAQGVLHFLDRKKHMIRRSGQNIAAAEIEACLRELPGIAEVAVLAVPDELREEEVMACIIPRPGADTDQAAAKAIVEACLARLAYFKVPAWILFVASLPTTATQKLQKTQIFQAGEDPRQRAGVFDFRALKQRAPKGG